MYQRLKTILLKFTVIVMVFSIMGIPSLYHHCLLHGDHNWQSGFFSDFHENHCVCCEDVEDEDTETNTICSACCHVEVVSLQVVATESFPKQQIKQALNFISSFDVPCQHISTGIFPQLNFSLPLPYLDFSPPRAAIFLFVQLLL